MSYPSKGRADYLELGDWNAVCYQCGRKRKASTLVRHWQGYYVCPEHWEVRHPQDFVRGIKDIQTPPWVQPMPGSSTGTTFSNLLPSYASWANGSTITDTFALTTVEIPWNPGGNTINNFVLTDYVTPPTAAGTVIVTIPAGTTISGSFTLGTGWPSGTTFVINNSGSVIVAPIWPANTSITLNGVSSGVTVKSPTYKVNWNGYLYTTNIWGVRGLSGDSTIWRLAEGSSVTGKQTTVSTSYGWSKNGFTCLVEDDGAGTMTAISGLVSVVSSNITGGSTSVLSADGTIALGTSTVVGETFVKLVWNGLTFVETRYTLPTPFNTAVTAASPAVQSLTVSPTVTGATYPKYANAASLPMYMDVTTGLSWFYGDGVDVDRLYCGNTTFTYYLSALAITAPLVTWTLSYPTALITSVEGYWNNSSSGISYSDKVVITSLIGAWSGVTTYHRGDVVSYNGTHYISRTTNLNSTPPTAAAQAAGTDWVETVGIYYDWTVKTVWGGSALNLSTGAWSADTHYDNNSTTSLTVYRSSASRAGSLNWFSNYSTAVAGRRSWTTSGYASLANNSTAYLPFATALPVWDYAGTRHTEVFGVFTTPTLLTESFTDSGLGGTTPPTVILNLGVTTVRTSYSTDANVTLDGTLWATTANTPLNLEAIAGLTPTGYGTITDATGSIWVSGGGAVHGTSWTLSKDGTVAFTITGGLPTLYRNGALIWTGTTADPRARDTSFDDNVLFFGTMAGNYIAYTVSGNTPYVITGIATIYLDGTGTYDFTTGVSFTLDKCVRAL